MISRRHPLARRLLWAVLATGLALWGLEWGAAGIEHLLPTQRTLPTPSPNQKVTVPEVREAERALAGQPDWGTRIPLAEDPDLGWALQPGATFRGSGVTVRINNRGERGPDLPPRQPGEQRERSERGGLPPPAGEAEGAKAQERERPRLRNRL